MTYISQMSQNIYGTYFGLKQLKEQGQFKAQQVIWFTSITPFQEFEWNAIEKKLCSSKDRYEICVNYPLLFKRDSLWDFIRIYLLLSLSMIEWKTLIMINYSYRIMIFHTLAQFWYLNLIFVFSRAYSQVDWKNSIKM